MADNPPISTEVPETITIDTGADPKQITDLNAAFTDFWQKEDAQTESTTEPEPKPEPPPAPAPAAPAPEPPAAKPETKPAPVETKPPQAETSPTDEEIERMTLPPSAKPEHVNDFRKMKECWQRDRVRMQAAVDRSSALETELVLARQNAWTPEQKADYENAAQVRRRFEFASDPEFIQKFQQPIYNRFQTLIDEAVSVLPDPRAPAWGEEVKRNFKPDDLSRDWWLNSVAAKIPGELERQAFLQGVAELGKLQRERNIEISHRTESQDAYDNYRNEQAQAVQTRIQREIMAEIAEQEKTKIIQDILPRDPSAAKTTDERRAIEAHNERFNNLHGQFQNYLKDISGSARGWVRVAVQAARSVSLEDQIKSLNEEVKALTTERDQLKGDLEKISGARRKLTQATAGTPPASTDKKMNGLSIKDLDVRKSFDRYEWGENQ